MKLIIDISQEDYNGICHLTKEQLNVLPIEVAETLMLIKHGIPLKDEVMLATLMSLVTDKDYKPKLEEKMTGREKLIRYCQDHNAEEIYEYLKHLFDYSLSWTDSRLYIIGWLEGEKDEADN